MSRSEGHVSAQSNTSRHARTDSFKQSNSGVCLCSNSYWMGEGEESGGMAEKHVGKRTQEGESVEVNMEQDCCLERSSRLLYLLELNSIPVLVLLCILLSLLVLPVPPPKNTIALQNIHHKQNCPRKLILNLQRNMFWTKTLTSIIYYDLHIYRKNWTILTSHWILDLYCKWKIFFKFQCIEPARLIMHPTHRCHFIINLSPENAKKNASNKIFCCPWLWSFLTLVI